MTIPANIAYTLSGAAARPLAGAVAPSRESLTADGCGVPSETGMRATRAAKLGEA